MKYKIQTILLLTLTLTITLLSLQHSHAAEMREWKSNKGTKINAELLFAGETLIVLKTDKGKEISIPISSLGAQEIAYLKELKGKTATPAASEKMEEKEAEKVVAEPDPDDAKRPKKEARAKKGKKKSVEDEDDEEVVIDEGKALPVLTEGPGKGFHAYYEGEKYIAELNRNGHLLIYIKDKTGAADRRWKMRVKAGSQVRKENAGWLQFKFEKILKSNPAKKDATEVKFTFQSETGIVTDVIFEFKPEGFTSWARSEVGPSTPEKTIHMMSHHYSNLNKISKDKEYHKKVKFKRETVAGKKERYDFEEKLRISGETEECEVSGIFGGKTKIIIERGRDEDVKLTPAQYSDMPLSNGFSLNSMKSDCTTDKHKSEKSTITIR